MSWEHATPPPLKFQHRRNRHRRIFYLASISPQQPLPAWDWTLGLLVLLLWAPLCPRSIVSGIKENKGAHRTWKSRTLAWRRGSDHPPIQRLIGFLEEKTYHFKVSALQKTGPVVFCLEKIQQLFTVLLVPSTTSGSTGMKASNALTLSPCSTAGSPYLIHSWGTFTNLLLQISIETSFTASLDNLLELCSIVKKWFSNS